MAKPNKTYYGKVKDLLKEYKKEEDEKVDEVDERNRVLFIEDKEELRKLVAKEEEDFGKYNNMCHLCKKFEHKTSYCTTYNCHPYETAVSAYDFCTDFTVDKTNVKTRNTKPKKLQM